jgi:predicted transcriptional regulator
MHGAMHGKPKVDASLLARLLKLRGEGLTSREIGARLGLSRSTVEQHLRNQHGTSSASPRPSGQQRDAKGRLLPKGR